MTKTEREELREEYANIKALVIDTSLLFSLLDTIDDLERQLAEAKSELRVRRKIDYEIQAQG